MFNVLSKLSSMLLVVLLTGENHASKMTVFFVEEVAQSEGFANMSSAATNMSSAVTALQDRQLGDSPRGHEDGKDDKNSTRPGDVDNDRVKSGKKSLQFYITEEPNVTEPVTTESGVNIANESATANADKAGADKGRGKRSKMLIGEVSDEEREYIKFELRELMGLVGFLKDRELSPALDPPLGELQTALDTLMVDADELKARSS